MKTCKFDMTRGAQALVLAALPLAVTHALAATQLLRADVFSANMPGGAVTMWGYVPDNAPCGTGGTTPWTPGPQIVVPPGDSTLTVTLKNCLPESTSLIINGQAISDPNPVWTDGGSGPRGGDLTRRVRSFTHEALAGGGTADYVWSNLKPGTYLYQSGTHPQVQVQMGLYGAMSKDAAAGNVAYVRDATSIAYNNQLTLLYSEIDPALHAAVANGAYGTSLGPTSTLNYAPKYFLINGKSYPDASLSPIATVPAGQGSLLRLLNASLKNHVPSINGQYWKMIAEDGNPYPYLSNPRQQYTAFLAAGKTMDVLLTPTNTSTTANVRYAIFDGRHFDTNNAVQGGGMLAYLDVAPSAPAAPVFDSTPVTTGTAGVAYSYAAHATDPNGDTVSYSLNAPVQSGMAINAGTGQINWTPAAAGTYAVSVRASDATVPTPLFSDQAFSVAVAPGAAPNQSPTARNDAYTAVAHAAGSGINQSVTAPGVLANDSDPDAGNTLTAVNKAGSTRVTLGADGSFVLLPPQTGSGVGTVTFTYQARDNSGAANNTSAAATATINVIANRRPVAVADAFTVPRCATGTGNICLTGAPNYVPLVLNLANNDSDPDTATTDVANQLPLSVNRLRAGTNGNGVTAGTLTTSSGGLVTFSGTTTTGVNVTYVPRRNFAGTDTFQYKVKDRLGLESGATNAQGWATVTVTVQ